MTVHPSTIAAQLHSAAYQIAQLISIIENIQSVDWQTVKDRILSAEDRAQQLEVLAAALTGK